MARDLRLITMAMKISNDLERVGDHAVNIAEGVPHLVDSPLFAELPEVEEMARLAGEMLSDALDCFVRADAANARDVIDRDDRVDQMAESLFRILLTHMMEDPRRIGPSMTLFLVSRNLERIADLATNIAEDVVFLVEGRNIKHGLRIEPA
jgi:phosphate transport system protein